MKFPSFSALLNHLDTARKVHQDITHQEHDCQGFITVAELKAFLVGYDDNAPVLFHTATRANMHLLSIYPEDEEAASAKEVNIDLGYEGE